MVNNTADEIIGGMPLLSGAKKAATSQEAELLILFSGMIKTFSIVFL